MFNFWASREIFANLRKKMMTIGIPSTMLSPISHQMIPFWRLTFDPQSRIINFCDRLLLFVAIFSLYIDPYFVYLPIANDSGTVTLDLRLGFYVAFLRVIGDSLIFLSIILKFRTAYEDQANAFGKRELVKDPKLIAMKYLKSNFILDIVCALPLPQLYMWYCISTSKPSQAVDVYFNMIWILETQFLPRLVMTLSFYSKIEKNTGIVIRNPWSGTLYILFVYGMLSHFLGAAFYLMYTIKFLVCRKVPLEKGLNSTTYEWDQLVTECNHKNGKEGLTSEAFANNVGFRSFSQKFMFCFSWGLKTISSIGQNINSSASVPDTGFVLLVIVSGLLLFADLISRMQTCMQSVGDREEQQMLRQRELEDWSNFHQLPQILKKRVRESVHSQFLGNRAIESEAILDSLPMDLRLEIRRHLYLELVCNSPIFEDVDDQLLHAICGHLRTFTSTEGMFIYLEGDPVQQVLFIISGKLEMFSIDGGSSYTSIGPGGLCGHELLTWASLSSTSTHSLPSSTLTVRCLTNVEAFSLLARDMMLLAIQFNHDKKLFDALWHHSSQDPS